MEAFPAFNRQKACRHGQMLYNIHDLYIGRSLDLYGEYSEHEVTLFRQLLSPGETVVEVGANIGCHTLPLARQIGPQGQLLAFEPQRILFQTLCANLALNSITNVLCLQQAVGARDGVLLIPPLDYTIENNFGGIPLAGHASGEQVRMVTLDGFQLERCHLLKIDVEGMEHDVLTGAINTITRLKPILYVENDKQDKSLELARLIESLGYKMYWHPPLLYNPNNFLGNQVNVFAEIFSRNMLCVHRSVPHNFKGLQPVEMPPPGESKIISPVTPAP